MKFRILEEFMVSGGGSVDPHKFKNEVFELLSIPAYDKGQPEILEGQKIGSSKKVVNPSDVLLSKIVPHIRRCWIVPKRKDYRQIASGEWIQFRSDELFPEYLRYFLISDPFHSRFMKTVSGVGGSLLRASPVKVAELKIPVPPLEDQKRIAYLLGKVEGLIAQRKQHLQQLDELLKSVFLEMFGDPVQNEKEWETWPCNKVVIDINAGTSYGGEEKEVLDDDEYGVLKISAVTQGRFNPKEFKAVKKSVIHKPLRFLKRGDFLFSRANTIELVAACCIVPRDYDNLFLPDKLWALSLSEKVNPQYLNFLLKNRSFRNLVRKQASGGHDSMLNISMEKFLSLTVPVPKEGLQDQFASIVEKVEEVRSYYTESLAELETLYGALSQKAFKGELDLARIPLPTESSDEAVENEPELEVKPIMESLSEFPAPSDLSLLKSPESRRELLGEWLAIWLDQRGNSPLSIQDFLSNSQERIWDLFKDEPLFSETPVLGVADYDEIKTRIFSAVEEGPMQQIYNDAKNEVQITAAKG